MILACPDRGPKLIIEGGASPSFISGFKHPHFNEDLYSNLCLWSDQLASVGIHHPVCVCHNVINHILSKLKDNRFTVLCWLPSDTVDISSGNERNLLWLFSKANYPHLVYVGTEIPLMWPMGCRQAICKVQQVAHY